jgi:hypothetical protein
MPDVIIHSMKAERDDGRECLLNNSLNLFRLFFSLCLVFIQQQMFCIATNRIRSLNTRYLWRKDFLYVLCIGRHSSWISYVSVDRRETQHICGLFTQVLQKMPQDANYRGKSIITFSFQRLSFGSPVFHGFVLKPKIHLISLVLFFTLCRYQRPT